MTVRDRLATLLGGAPGVGRITDLGRSHAWTLHRAELADGREVFVKAAVAGRHDALRAEYEGLRWLRQAGPRERAEPPGPAPALVPAPGRTPDVGRAPDVASAPALVPVPEVLAADDTMLVLPWLEPRPPDQKAAERFGRELAVLHSASPGAFGAPWPGFIAELPLDNGPGRSWPEWYAARRLEPYLRGAHDVLGADGVRLVERVIDDIEELAGPAEPPSRIHGDLWSGNLLWTGGRGLLIDPAAHGGHRETDLAMLALFGAPWLDRILAAYDEVAPLAPGRSTRVPMHQLHPLLVHVVLFGAAYRSATLDAARRALSSVS